MFELTSIEEMNRKSIEKIKQQSKMKRQASVNSYGKVSINEYEDDSDSDDFYDHRTREWKKIQKNSDNLEKLSRTDKKISNVVFPIKVLLMRISSDIKENESLFDSRDVAIFNKINNDYFPSIINNYLNLPTLKKEEKEEEVINALNEIEKKLKKMTSFFEEQSINKLDKILSLSNYMVNL